MGEKRKVLMKVWLVLCFIVLIHSSAHILIYGTGVSGFAERGVSGLSIGELNIGETLRMHYSQGSYFSQIILIFEWVFAIFFFIFLLTKFFISLLTKQKVLMKENVFKLQVKRNKDSLTETDIDNLYNLLREQKNLKLGTICSLFGVDKEVALSWGRTLEAARLIIIDYPSFGDPDFVYQEQFDKGGKL